MRILIVEDDKRLAQSIKKFLTRLGHEVDCAINGKVALRALKRGSYNGVISDVQMPGGNGVELLQSAAWSLQNIPPFYVHSSEDVFVWADRQWNLPKEIPEFFGEFAIFRNKLTSDMLTEITSWLDSIEEK